VLRPRALLRFFSIGGNLLRCSARSTRGSLGGVQSMQLQEFFHRAGRQYESITPSARKIRELLEARGEIIVNDHIALRTFADHAVGLDVVAAYFLDNGYRMAPQRYEFPGKRLRARHLEHPDGLPKIFVSELLLEDCSPRLQALVSGLLSQLPEEIDFPGLFAAARPWSLRRDDYEVLARESEYAAWLAALGYQPNHFTVSVNHLRTFPDLEALNAFLREKGFSLNVAGGEIKGSPAECLEQSSTVADRGEVAFTDGRMTIPTCYYEFARRYPVDGSKPADLYQGFVAASADRIFESTDRAAPAASSGPETRAVDRAP
jgi:hypothetical protein